MIKYDKLWETLSKKGISQNTLLREYNLSKGQLDRLKKNKVVYTSTIDKLCNVLNCGLDDVMEHIPDDNKF
ncbi:helix-turn-helix domain-containing protein [[Eubacterium] hominis]|uniref:helix-turn-helix domain-containing protein n=1 Tax=[Eubacterium] hominis TaxID=2764325 RepID=UPI003A4DA75B